MANGYLQGKPGQVQEIREAKIIILGESKYTCMEYVRDKSTFSLISITL